MMNSAREEKELKNEVMTGSEAMTIQDGTVKLRAQVDAMIEHWFTDMWLLVSDEDSHDFSRPLLGTDQKVLALAYRGQLHLLESKPSALNVLRSVGILMKS